MIIPVVCSMLFSFFLYISPICCDSIVIVYIVFSVYESRLLHEDFGLVFRLLRAYCKLKLRLETRTGMRPENIKLRWRLGIIKCTEAKIQIHTVLID